MSEKRVLTPEVKAALMSKVPFHKDARVEYTPKAYITDEIPVEFRPVFTLRPFTKVEAVEVKKACIKADDVVVRKWSQLICLGWVNMIDSGTGENVEYVADPTGGVDKDLWATMPDHIVADILMYASCISGLLDKDKLGL